MVYENDSFLKSSKPKRNQPWRKNASQKKPYSKVRFQWVVLIQQFVPDFEGEKSDENPEKEGGKNCGNIPEHSMFHTYRVKIMIEEAPFVSSLLQYTPGNRFLMRKAIFSLP